MEELNYFPNTAARTLITNQTYKIGLVLKGSEPIRLNPFYINVLLEFLKRVTSMAMVHKRQSQII